MNKAIMVENCNTQNIIINWLCIIGECMILRIIMCRDNILWGSGEIIRWLEIIIYLNNLVEIDLKIII